MTPKQLRQYYKSDEFLSEFYYNGHDLGASVLEHETVFKLWSPLAVNVLLNLYEDGDQAPCEKTVPMEREDRGVWCSRLPGNLHGTYYDFLISFDEGETNEMTRTADPYAKACGINGHRSMAVDLRTTDPKDWDKDLAPVRGPEDMIYELHVKEFSWDESAGFPRDCRGKYTAFLQDQTTLHDDGAHVTGISYLKKLGVTHIQLMPVYDYGSVDEAGGDEAFNWGYDPVNYNVPEGSYSTDPAKGQVRIRELKELVASLHRNGFRVIMDVVYNHTYRRDSWLQRTVPYYYYRQNEDGTLSEGSCCGNDIASERRMCADYILESVLYWALEYHMDGFRFDLMGLLDTDLMNRIQEELDRICGPGEKLIYGEPWAAGYTAMEPGAYPAKKDHVDRLKTSIGIFCDNTRDAIKGHVFLADRPGFVNGGRGLERELLCGVSAWCGPDSPLKLTAPSQVITYVSAHDNLTLWDKLILTIRPDCGFHEKPKEVMDAYRLAAAIYFTCQGRLFLLSGEEFARTKEGVEDSFCSPIGINRLDYDRAYENEDLVDYYRGLIALRKRLFGLCDKTEAAPERIFRKRVEKNGVVSFCVHNQGPEQTRPGGKNFNERSWETLYIAYNSTHRPARLRLPSRKDKWTVLADGDNSWHWRKEDGVSVQEIVSVPPVSAVILGKRN